MIDVGSVIANKYRLLRLLGEGGMGSVFEAEHLGLGSRVAVKVLHPELARRSGLVERFLQEARVAAQIRSPHVVRVADVDRTPAGQAYIVMDLLVGEPLSAVLQRERRLPVAVASEYTSQVLDALEAAHALGVIHRDLKPENVFVTTEGGKPLLKLIDFGIAKARRGETEKTLTVAGSVMGTAEYMAPEQARSAGAVDARADIYAVGVMLYEMIAGVRPVTGEDARAVAAKVERGEVAALLHVAPDAPRDVAGIVHHAMAPRPEMRFASAAEMRVALRDARAGKAPASFAPPVPSERPVPTQRALPIAPALGPAFAQSAATAATPPAPPAPHRARGRGVLVALLVLGIVGLVGAGGALAVQAGVFASTPSAPPAAAPAPAAVAPPASAVSSATAAGPAAPATAGAATVPALLPTRPSAPSGPPGRTVPGSGDAGRAAPEPPVFPGFPTSIPGFPSSLPFPTAFPSGLPSGFPTALPSGFPAILPPWPAAPPPAPAPAPSASGPTI